MDCAEGQYASESFACKCHVVLRLVSSVSVTNSPSRNAAGLPEIMGQCRKCLPTDCFHKPASWKGPVIKKITSFWVASVMALVVSSAAQAGTPSVNASLEGALAPGVYGRIEIGSGPPPPLVYVQPLVVRRAPVFVEQPPLYLHVPPGHAKKWSKHCARYNACDRPVYFVRVRGDDEFERHRGQYRGHRDDGKRGHDDGHGKHHDKRHGKGDHHKGHRD